MIIYYVQRNKGSWDDATQYPIASFYTSEQAESYKHKKQIQLAYLIKNIDERVDKLIAIRRDIPYWLLDLQCDLKDINGHSIRKLFLHKQILIKKTE